MLDIDTPRRDRTTLGPSNSLFQAGPLVLQLISSRIEGITRGRHSATRDLMLSVWDGVALVTYGSEMLDRVDRLLVYFLFVTGRSPVIPV